MTLMTMQKTLPQDPLDKRKLVAPCLLEKTVDNGDRLREPASSTHDQKEDATVRHKEPASSPRDRKEDRDRDREDRNHDHDRDHDRCFESPGVARNRRRKESNRDRCRDIDVPNSMVQLIQPLR